jgi:class 3 adenylate cyclase
VGDHVLRIEDTELRGLSRNEVYGVQAPLLRTGEPYRVEFQRQDKRLDAMVAPAYYPHWWLRIFGGVGLALAGGFLLIRAPHWHLSRRFFFSMLLLSLYPALDLGFPHLSWLVGVLWPAGLTLLLWNGQEWTESARPLRARHHVVLWTLGLAQAVSFLAYLFLVIPAGLWTTRVTQITGSLIGTLTIAYLARAYALSGSLERRQLRWVFSGISVAFIPQVILVLAITLEIQFNYHAWRPRIGALSVAVPIGIVISIVGYHWLDIDRLISRTAALTIVAVTCAGAAPAVVPRLAVGASGATGIDTGLAQIVISIVLAGLAVPAYRVLHLWLDRRMFAEQHALAGRFERLRTDLASCRTVEELTTRGGEGFDAILHPDSIATYARVGGAFTPLFVRGRAAPPAFETTTALVQVLEAKGGPLFARAREIGPFERAALDTLGAEVVVPVLQDGRLVAFTCLAGKRSGDIYTATDLERLGAVAERSADVLARLDADAVAQEARELTAALSRYVPGAVAERVLRGHALEPAEREVSVLFVDIREYTRIAAGLRPEDVFSTLNEHTERVSRIVQDFGGTIVEFNGDGMMAVFGAPEALARKEQAAVESARRIVDSMPEGLAVGVGVATGPAFVGSIRSADRLIWTAVGNTTNLASRLQSLTRELDASIALDETTRDRAGYVCSGFVRHQRVAIRGRWGRFDVYTLPLRGAGSDQWELTGAAL